jgi:hypothetical protein
MRKFAILLSLIGLILALSIPAMAKNATCSGIVGEVHGHHIVADYVTGEGNANMDWPPVGGADARGGAAVPGGPGPGFHFEHGFAPGASFCLSQSQSPGFHIP